MKKPTILLVDDDADITEFMSESLSEKFEVLSTGDVESAYQMAIQNQIDGILLDIHVKEESGISLCERLRQNLLTKKIPIVIMTGMGTRDKMLSAFEVGADDFIEKPVDFGLLENRLLSRMKRVEGLSSRIKIVGNLKVIPERNEVELSGKNHRLSQTEFTLLQLLLMNINRNISRQEIMKSLWSDANVEERTVDVHISSLRRKLKDFDHRIEALYGSGYILRPLIVTQN